MPQLGIDDNRLASVNDIPRAASAGIKKAMPLMKRKELAVTHTEMIMTDQRRRALIWPAVFGSAGIRSCWHTRLRLIPCFLGDGPQRPAAPRSRPSRGSTVTARSARLRRARDRHGAQR